MPPTAIDPAKVRQDTVLRIMALPNLLESDRRRDPVAHADARTSLADLHIALSIARGTPYEHIHPASGAAYTLAAYENARDKRQQNHAWTVARGDDAAELYHVHRDVMEARRTQHEFLSFRPDLDPAQWFPCHTVETCGFCELIAAGEAELGEGEWILP